MRTRQINIRLDEDEYARFVRVARYHELTVAQTMRQLVMREDEAIGRRRGTRKLPARAT